MFRNRIFLAALAAIALFISGCASSERTTRTMPYDDYFGDDIVYHQHLQPPDDDDFHDYEDEWEDDLEDEWEDRWDG